MYKTIVAYLTLALMFASSNSSSTDVTTKNYFNELTPANNCIYFTVGSGTGCDWICNYCANMLSTGNYYFPDGVCTYMSGGCVGNPIAGKMYSCCAV